MRGFVFLAILGGYFAVLASYAITVAQGRSVTRLSHSCRKNAQAECASAHPSGNAILICLRAQGRQDKGCLVAFSAVTYARQPQAWPQLLLRPKVN